MAPTYANLLRSRTPICSKLIRFSKFAARALPLGGHRTDDPAESCADRVVECFESFTLCYRPRRFRVSCFAAGIIGWEIPVGVAWSAGHRGHPSVTSLKRQRVPQGYVPKFHKRDHFHSQKGPLRWKGISTGGAVLAELGQSGFQNRPLKENPAEAGVKLVWGGTLQRERYLDTRVEGFGVCHISHDRRRLHGTASADPTRLLQGQSAASPAQRLTGRRPTKHDPRCQGPSLESCAVTRARGRNCNATGRGRLPPRGSPASGIVDHRGAVLSAETVNE